MAKKSKASPVSRLPVLAGMLMSVLHYDKSELRSLIESRLKPQLVRYLERGLGRSVTDEDAYHLHVGLDPDLVPLTFEYAKILRYCKECEDQHYSDGSCHNLIAYVLVAAPHQFAETIRKEHRFARRGGPTAAAKSKADKTDTKVLAAWNALLSKPKHNRASMIAKQEKIRPATVRTSITRLKKAGRIKK